MSTIRNVKGSSDIRKIILDRFSMREWDIPEVEVVSIRIK